LGFICGALFIFFARPRPLTLALGGIIALIGLAVRAWSAGHIRKNDKLAITGPYAYTRNPLYLGSFIMGLGFTIAAGRWWLGLIFAALFLGIYLPVMRVEAGTMVELFGPDFQRYSKSVPLFFPRLAPYRDGSSDSVKFDPGLYMRYREYQAAMGVAFAWLLLAVIACFR
jgi:protein-S-isoprenylcysteine O-methyltransferase Ste14